MYLQRVTVSYSDEVYSDESLGGGRWAPAAAAAGGGGWRRI